MPSRQAGVIGRIANLVRATAARQRRPHAPPPGPPAANLEVRVDRLEQMVEALQDQLYRQARLDDERFAALHHNLQPDEMARALSADARRRGI
jgi:hypothetical protein